MGASAGLILAWILGFLGGAAVMWAFARARANERERATAEARTALGETFAALGADALRHNNESFLALAEQRFARLLDADKQDGDQRQQAIEQTLGPIRELVKSHDEAVRAIEKSRLQAYSELRTQVEGISQAHAQLQGTTAKLVTALRRPEQRGRWGEMQLQRVAELAGMAEHCDFDTQVHIDGDDGAVRPDMVVHLPGNGEIIVDAKVPLDAYLDALDADADRDACLARHARQLRTHFQGLARKEYWKSFEHTPELVVMFVPVESALAAALDADPALHAEALERHVLIATPTLLVAVLRAVAYGWRQESVAENARHIAEVGHKLHERVGKFLEHFDKVGGALRKASETYNQAVGSFESRVLVTVRELKQLGATANVELERPQLVEVTARSLALVVPSDDGATDEIGQDRAVSNGSVVARTA